MTIEEVHDAQLEPAPAPPAPRKSWREQRWERRRRRYFFEEIVGWIVVPLILIGAYWAVIGALDAMGTSPAALIQGVQTVLQGLH
ncbi:MAG TPA: hypothetical protein VH743_12945 [Beijerinckiaceae bacterium]|jgi:hypothetical protein